MNVYFMVTQNTILNPIQTSHYETQIVTQILVTCELFFFPKHHIKSHTTTT